MRDGDFMWRLSVTVVITLMLVLLFSGQTFAAEPPDAPVDAPDTESSYTEDNASVPPDSPDGTDSGSIDDDIISPAPDDIPLGNDVSSAAPVAPANAEPFDEDETPEQLEGIDRLADDVFRIRQSLELMLYGVFPFIVAVFFVVKSCKWFLETFCIEFFL